MIRFVIALMPMCLWSVFGSGQDSIPTTVSTPKDTTWFFTGINTLNFSQVALKNWSGGGQSAISGTALISHKLTYRKGKTLWESQLNLAYGVQQADKIGTRKTDDRIELITTYGKEAFGKWYYTSSAQFRSQFSPGYNYPNDSVVISNFLAPGYVQVMVGLENKIRDCFLVFVAPLTAKYTIVNDRALSAYGAFGVDPGKRFRQEYGGSVRTQYSCPIMENVQLSAQLDLFSNYVRKPFNIDVNGQAILSCKVNKYISTSIAANLIYDDDIKITEDKDADGVPELIGPRTQFKEVFNLGIQYSL